MAMIENTVLLPRTPEEVFDYLVDLRSELEWNPDAVSMEKITDGPIGVGTTFRAKWKQGPAAEVRCTRYERPTRWSYLSEGPLTFDFDASLREEAGGTRLVVHFGVTPKGWMRLLFPLMVLVFRRAERKNMERIRRALSRRAEGTLPATAAGP